MRQSFRNACFKRVLLRIVFQQIAKIYAAVAEQAKMELANGGDAQAVAAGAEVFLIGHDKPYLTFVIRVAEDLRRAVAALADLVDPAASQQRVAQHHAGDVMATEQLAALAGFHQLDKTQLYRAGFDPRQKVSS